MIDKGPAEFAAEHASAVAREVVRAGLADVEVARKLYAEYGELLRVHGPKGTFSQLLLARGVIDRAGFDRLQAACPPTGLAGTSASQVTRLPPSALVPTGASQVTRLPAGAAAPTPGSSRQSQVAVLPPAPADAEVGARTLEFESVLAPGAPTPGAPKDGAGKRGNGSGRAGPAPPSDLGERTGFYDKVLVPDVDSVLDSGDGLTLAPPRPAPAQPELLDGTTCPSSSVLPIPTRAELDATRGPPRVASTADSRPSRGSAGSSGSSGSSGSAGSAGSSGSGGSAGSRRSGPSGPSSGDGLALAGGPGFQLDAAGPSGELPADFFLSDEASAPSGEAPAAPSEPQVGQVLGGYRLLKVLGRGGMGIIFTAKREPQAGVAPDETIVALKALLGTQDVGADRRRQRFRCEFEALRRLDHEGIVKVFDFGRDGAFDWYTMEYVEGKDFEKLLLENTLEPAERLSIYHDIVEAIAHAHERQVVHRDLKPQNVLVDAKGRGRVLDFGLAKLLDQGAGMTRTGSSLGTPFYMAPEQLRSAKHIDARADVFALGVILFEVTVGHRPFTGETAAEVGQNILNVDPPRPSKLKKTIHPDLDAICLKALEKDPERRYPHAGALLEDLKRHRKGLGVGGATGVQGAVGEARRWASRNKAGIIGGLVASAALVPVMLVLIVKAGGKAPPPGSGTEPGGTTTEAPKATTERPPRPATEAPGPTPKPATERPPRPTTEAPRPTTEAPRPTTEAPRPATEAPRPATEAPPKPTTEAPDASQGSRTPEELARLALEPPDEPGPPGADQARERNAGATLRALVLALEAEVLPALGAGELDRAVVAVNRLRRDPEVALAGLADEVDHDVTTLRRLRDLAALRLRADPKGFKADLWAGAAGTVTVRGAFDGLTDAGLVRVKDGPTTTLVDPLALELAVLRPLVLAVGPKAEAQNGPARYALAVLGAWRGLTERDLDKDFTAAGGGQAVQSRRQLARWLEEVRPQVARGLEDEAAGAWRELTTGRRSEAQVVAGVDEFVRAYGRTAAWRERREEAVKLLVDRQGPQELLAGTSRRGKPEVAWDPLRDAALADVEVAPLKEDRPFRAEAEAGAVAVNNARVWVDLVDLVPDQGEVELAAPGGLVAATLGLVTQELDPVTAWVVKADGKKVGEDAKRRSGLGSGKVLAFERGGTDAAPLRVLKLGAERLEVPLAQAPLARPSTGATLGAAAEGDLRVKGLRVAWRDDAEAKRPERLLRRLVERRLLGAFVDAGAPRGQAVATLDAARLTGLALAGSVEVAGDGLALGGGSSVTTLAWADAGVLRLRLGLDDGPGVRVALRPAGGGGGAAVQWTIPARLQPDLARARAVEVRFDLRAKVATAVVDGVPLKAVLPGAGTGAAPQTPTRAVAVVETLGRTRATLAALELVQVVPRGR